MEVDLGVLAVVAGGQEVWAVRPAVMEEAEELVVARVEGWAASGLAKMPRGAAQNGRQLQRQSPVQTRCRRYAGSVESQALEPKLRKQGCHNVSKLADWRQPLVAQMHQEHSGESAPLRL